MKRFVITKLESTVRGWRDGSNIFVNGVFTVPCFNLESYVGDISGFNAQKMTKLEILLDADNEERFNAELLLLSL